VATGRKLDNRRHGKRPRQGTKAAAEELALAEELLRVSRKEQAGLVAEWDKVMKQLGLDVKPIGAKKLQEMLLKRGFDPESNEFSRGIVEMREE
jgi:hypothetical protein